MPARYIVGDVRAVLAAMPKQSVDLVLTSPPFFNLRSYLSPDDENKTLEIGQESTPGEYVDTLLNIVELCADVLAPHGSLVFELGDTYAGSGGAGGDYLDQGFRAGQPKFIGSGKLGRRADGNGGMVFRGGQRQKDKQGDDFPLDRSLCLIPEIFRFSLVYGFNPLTGRQTPIWRARNVVRWVRPNPPVGSLGDKFRPGTSDMVVVCKDRRYFDLDAVRTEPLTGDRVMRQTTPTLDPERTRHLPNHGERLQSNNPAGVPPLDWWLIPTQPYPGSHYATWPEKLCEIPIESMCPRRVCRECGKPSTRIVERESKGYGTYQVEANGVGMHRRPGREIPNNAERTTIGWTDCGHNAWRPGITLDPFAGSGTTLQVATGHGRDALGIDLDPRNASLAIERVGGLFLEVEHFSNEDLTPAQ